ncbi:phosphotransferase family protein [Dinoroseobacter sp. S76]|uniref:phosphotransferase family protein n=1 Tax=Dinoroseobacter sp. S76 TaxID=3415124 RepID=UPI003C7AA706
MAKIAPPSPQTELPLEVSNALSGLGLSSKGLGQIHKGHTSQVWVHTPEIGTRLVVKYTNPARSSALFPNAPELEWAAMKALSHRALSAQPLTFQWLPSGAALILSQFVPTHGALTPLALATTLREIHQTPVWPDLPVCRKSSMDLLLDGHAMLAKSRPPAWLTRLAPPNRDVPNPLPLRLVHRDLVPANVAILDTSKAIALDWQCPAQGDPCEDIAHASSPGMQSLSKTDPIISDDALLEAYADAELARAYIRIAPYYRWRMACYCQMQLSQGNAIYAEALEKECAALEQACERAEHAS